MKKILSIALILVLSLALAACGGADGANEPSQTGGTSAPSEATPDKVTLKVGATAIPHAEILEFVKPKLAELGIELEIVEFQDYVLPNTSLAEGELDANYFQHIPWLEKTNEEKNLNLTYIKGIHIEPIGGYSKKHKSIDDLPNGALILYPDAASEEGRILNLLASKDLIKLKDGVGINGTLKDIVENKKNFEFKGIEAATLVQTYGEGDLAIINTNYALQAGLVPTKDALILEGSESPYVNVIAVRPEDKDNENLKKLVEALTTPEVKKFIEDKYEGAVVPAFE
ncbi:MAG: MetQ/NlpA family ABC transporter substrate-binding protein [Bacilli bacterium]